MRFRILLLFFVFCGGLFTAACFAQTASAPASQQAPAATQGPAYSLPPAKLQRLLRIPIVRGLVSKKVRRALGLDACAYAAGGAAPIATRNCVARK